MKIMFYIATMEHEGGAQRVMSVIANELCKNGDEILMVNDFPISDEEFKLSREIKRYYLAQSNQKGYLRKNCKRILQLRKKVRATKPDIIISFLYRQNIRMLLACTGINIKKLISVRNDPKREFGEKGVKRWLINRIYELSDGIVFQTNTEKEYFSKKIQNKSEVILNPIDDKFFRITPSISSDNIVTFGRLSSQKNQKNLISAFQDVYKKYPDERLYIYGEGELRKELEELVSSLNLKNAVYLPGRIDDVEKKMQEAKMFVLSSDYEGLPNALMEAMAAGVPVISTDCSGGGPGSIIRNDENGNLVECGNLSELSEAMIRYIESPDYRRKMAENAREFAAEFVTEKVVRKWRKYMADMMSNN